MFRKQCLSSSTVRLGVGVFVIAAAFLSAGCSKAQKTSWGATLSPYKIEVVQGNFVSKEQLELVQVGMSRNQVRTILGTPLLVDIFHPERWDYVFTIYRQGIEPVTKRVVVYFTEETVERIEAPDELFTEAEFVAYLDSTQKKKKKKDVPFEATPEQLEKASQKAQMYRERQEEEQKQRASDEDAASMGVGQYPPLDAN